MKEGIFGSVPVDNWKKAKFDLTHDVKLTGNMGPLMPVLCEEVLPSENWQWKGNLLIRFAPLLAPVMHRVKATMHAFFVANRTLCTDWKDAITGGADGESVDQIPSITVKNFLDHLKTQGALPFNNAVGVGSLWDYLGLPTAQYDALAVYDDLQKINALPFLAYQQIWQYYYKDQNVDTETTMQEGIAGGEITAGQMEGLYTVMRTRAWQKDPFTSALPWPQRGPDVLMPFSSIVDKAYDSLNQGQPVGAAGPVSVDNIGDIYQTTGIPNQIYFEGTNGTFTVNDMRTALVVQHWSELSARGGNRYNEYVKVQYGSTVPDFRIDQPEYIGGGTQQVRFSEVLTTANSLDADDNTIPPATMTGHGMTVGSGNTFRYHAQEHGWIIVILSIIPETNYQQGLPKKFTRIDRLDYALPVMAGLGEQEILKQEIYWDPTNTVNNSQIFGYQQRYWEYKALLNRTCGEFKTTLSYWTMTRIFASSPAQVGTEFIYADPTTRIFAVEDTSHKLWMQVIHELSVLRPLPYYSVPGVLKV